MVDKSRKGMFKRLGILLLIGLAAFAGIRWVQTHELLLTSVAHPIMQIDRKRQHVVWFSDHQVLITTSPPLSLTQQPASGKSHDRISVDLVDPATHKSQHWQTLSDLLTRETQFDDFLLSPDRSWLLWITNHALTPTTHVVHPDGTGYRTWEIMSSLDQTLFLDRRHLAQWFDGAPLLNIHDLQAPKQDRKITWFQKMETVLAPYVSQHPSWIKVKTNYRLPGQNPSQPHDRGDSLAIVTYPMSAQALLSIDAHPSQVSTIPLPDTTLFQQAYVSPQQTCILYHLRFVSSSPILVWLHRAFPKLPGDPEFTEALWISRADGSGLHEIGHEPYTITSQIDPNSRLEAIQWLPDGKRISFAYGGMLYVVPTEL